MKTKIILILSLILNVLFIILAISYIFTPFWDWAVFSKSFPRMCNFIKIYDPDSYKADDNYFAKTCDQYNGIEPSAMPQTKDNDENLQIYTSANMGISFQYPKNWYVREEPSSNRIYIENVQQDIDKSNIPEDFQRIWISTWGEEINEKTENNIKTGRPDGREILSDVSTSTLDSNSITINTYEYETIGGGTLQAFWKNKDGKRYYATNATEIGVENQKKMVENLKKILATIEFIK